jgi:hypothetical protein
MEMDEMFEKELDHQIEYGSGIYPGEDDETEDIGEDNDGLDMKSLATGEAELVYRDGDDTKDESEQEGKEEERDSTTKARRRRRTINLDSFHIVKVIGKGSFGKVSEHAHVELLKGQSRLYCRGSGVPCPRKDV